MYGHKNRLQSEHIKKVQHQSEETTPDKKGQHKTKTHIPQTHKKKSQPRPIVVHKELQVPAISMHYAYQQTGYDIQQSCQDCYGKNMKNFRKEKLPAGEPGNDVLPHGSIADF